VFILISGFLVSINSQIFNSLEGRWKFSRLITDQGSVEGVAYFRRTDDNPNVLFYREEGVFTSLQGIQYDISQEYEYRYSEDRIDVLFARERNRLLHSLEFIGPNQASGIHLCGYDTYCAGYQFHFPDRFELQYVVKGPKKNYQIETRFLKILNSEDTDIS